MKKNIILAALILGFAAISFAPAAFAKCSCDINKNDCQGTKTCCTSQQADVCKCRECGNFCNCSKCTFKKQANKAKK
ncbi:MAG: hypothetical protein PHE78_05465 [Candidatus Gastranaerophilales bacterium]|nr:hypothetical protein [Candidatus Gastranaerophilales bacterium]